jgi:hypothetical protein
MLLLPFLLLCLVFMINSTLSACRDCPSFIRSPFAYSVTVRCSSPFPSTALYCIFFYIHSSYTVLLRCRGFSFSFVSYTNGRTPWTSYRPVAMRVPIYRTTQTEKKHTHTPDIHALSGIRNHYHSVRASEDSSCLRPLGRCEGPTALYPPWNHLGSSPPLTLFAFQFHVQWAVLPFFSRILATFCARLHEMYTVAQNMEARFVSMTFVDVSLMKATV